MTDDATYTVKIEPSKHGGYLVSVKGPKIILRDAEHCETVADAKEWAREHVAWVQHREDPIEYTLAPDTGRDTSRGLSASELHKRATERNAYRVVFINDEGERVTMYGYGFTSDEGIADAFTRLLAPGDEYNRRGWAMDEWAAA
jgi:hypothetical protein